MYNTLQKKVGAPEKDEMLLFAKSTFHKTICLV